MHLLEFLYYLGLSASQRYSLAHQRRLPCTVISIGNITVGGTGKTPATIAVAEEALRRGLRPIILTRGYKGTMKGPCLVAGGEGPLLSVEEAGDEPMLMAERLRAVPIVKGGDRFDSGMFALRQLRVGDSELRSHIFILDDGFQHRALWRDKDIVLIDSGNPFGNRLLLPLGRLREPLEGLGRADIVVLTRTGEASEDKDRANEVMREVARFNLRSSFFSARHTPLSCVLQSGEEKPPKWLSGKKVFGFCALASPDAFRKSLAELGAEVLGFRAFRDHYKFTSKDISAVKTEAGRSGAEWIVASEKDIIKARELDLPDNLTALKVSFDADEGFFDQVFDFQ